MSIPRFLAARICCCAVFVLALAAGQRALAQPGAPGNLTATPVSAAAVTLTWDPPADTGAGLTAYQLNRCEGESCQPSYHKWFDRANPSRDNEFAARSFTDTGLRAGTTYRYVVIAYDGAFGDWSNYAAFPVDADRADAGAPAEPPGAPRNLTATPVSATAVTLTWDAPDGVGAGLTAYQLNRCRGESCQPSYYKWFDREYPSPNDEFAARSFTDTGLNEGATYRYVVIAHNGVFGNWSNYATFPENTIPEEFSASFESELQWFNRDRLPVFSGVSSFGAAAWRGERIQKQILVAGNTAPGGLSISATDLRSERNHLISSSAVSFRYPHFVVGDIEARRCGAYEQRSRIAHLADALADEPPRELPQSYPDMIWMAIDVPPDTPAGNYAGAVEIRSRSGEIAALEIMLEVLPRSVPETAKRRFHLDLWQFPATVLDRYHDANPERRIEAWSAGHYRLLQPFYLYLAELGQRAATTYIKEGAMGAPSMIRWIALDGGEGWRFDYTAFDRHVERLAEWGIDAQISAFSPIGWNKDEIPFRDEAGGRDAVLNAPLGSQTYARLWDLFLTDFKAHLIDKGWFGKTVLYMDEVPQDEMELVIDLIKRNDADWKIGLAYGHAQDDRVIRNLYDVSGYYETEVRVPTYDYQITTFYTSCSLARPNNFVAADASPADMAAMAWYAMARGHAGYLRWAFDNWKTFEPFDLRDGSHTAGDFSFVYRSGNDLDMTVVPSIRSELLRDGIEDFEKILVMRDEMRSCGRTDLLENLREAVALFATDALAAGRAANLLTTARAALDDLSRRQYCLPDAPGNPNAASVFAAPTAPDRYTPENTAAGPTRAGPPVARENFQFTIQM